MPDPTSCSSDDVQIKLPLELLQDIARRLPKRDLKNFRQMSKTMAATATSVLFESVFLSMDPSDLGKAELIMQNFGSMVRTLIVSPLYPNTVNMASYKQYVQNTSKYRSYIASIPRYTDRLPDRTRFSEHIKIGFRDFHRRQLEWSSWAHRKRFNQLLSTVQCAPNIRRMLLTDRPRLSDSQATARALLCRWEDCAIPQEIHDMFRLTFMESSMSTRVDDVWGTFYAGNSKLHEVVVDQSDKMFPMFRKDVHRLFALAKTTAGVRASISNLTKLEIGFDGLYDDVNEHPRGTRTVADSLRNAPNLQILSLHALYDKLSLPHIKSANLFQYAVHDCRFPDLNHFELVNCSIKGDELLEFLQNSPNLQHLILEKCRLQRPGLWRCLIEQLKSMFKLRSLSLIAIYGGWEKGDQELRYTDRNTALERFLLSGGSNPFRRAALEDYLKKYQPYDLFRFSQHDGSISIRTKSSRA